MCHGYACRVVADRNRSTGLIRSKPERARLLAIYLNDHLAGATAGQALARRLARTHRGTSLREQLERIATEVAEDRAALLELMARVGAHTAGYKVILAAAGERLSMLKPNGAVRGRSPLSDLVELEGMRLGVEGKAAGWRTLRQLAEVDLRLDVQQLDKLIARADRQRDTLEELRVRAARDALHNT